MLTIVCCVLDRRIVTLHQVYVIKAVADHVVAGVIGVAISEIELMEVV
jgi:hypothetical protein